LVRSRKARAAGTIDSITNLEDVSRINYSEDWLPPYDELRRELIRNWRLYETRSEMHCWAWRDLETRREGFKKRMEARAHNPKPKVKSGKGKGGSTQQNVGKRKADVDTSNLPCHKSSE
jgi:hypothetical protein